MSIENHVNDTEVVTEIETTDSIDQLAGKSNPEQVEFFKQAKDNLNKTDKEPTEAEKTALEGGWTSDKDAFEKKTGKVWVPAAEFNSRKSFFVKIDSLKKDNDELKAAILKQTAFLQETEERAYQRAITALTKEREAAIKSGNVEQFNQVEERMQETHKEMEDKVQKIGATPQQVEIPKETQDFADRNKHWFNTEEDNKSFVTEAIELENYWKLKRPELSPKELLVLVEGDMKHSHPDLFRSKRDEPAAVSTKSVKLSAKEPSLVTGLTDRQRELGNEMVKRGIYKHISQYADALKKIKG